eukprot:GHVL01043064.1.p1 GENE.GHVL01043064.1~~GHVL01043064.1.p1  ORF type:complete len:142 (+),score=34.24 GHVL01043064.1:236-661(+)
MDRWNNIQLMKAPQKLKIELDDQKKIAQSIINGKDRLVRELMNNLNGRHKEFVNTLKDESDDFNTMINQMHIDYRKVKESFMEKFEKRKESETERRAAILNKNAADLQTLFDKRKQMEESDFFQNRRDSASTSVIITLYIS